MILNKLVLRNDVKYQCCAFEDYFSSPTFNGRSECIMLLQVDITERSKVEATLAKLTESQVGFIEGHHLSSATFSRDWDLALLQRVV